MTNRLTTNEMNRWGVIANRHHILINWIYAFAAPNPEGPDLLVTTHVLKGPIELNAGDTLLMDGHEYTVIPSQMNRKERRAYEKRYATRKPLSILNGHQAPKHGEG